MRIKPLQFAKLRVLSISICMAGLASFSMAAGAAEKSPTIEPAKQQRPAETPEKKKRSRECEPITKVSCRRNR